MFDKKINRKLANKLNLKVKSGKLTPADAAKIWRDKT